MWSGLISVLCFLSVSYKTTLSNPYGGLNRYRYTTDVHLPFTEENDPNFWKENALHTLRDKLQAKINTNKAKNLILFLGDGMSVPTIASARIYLGQLDNKAGENAKLSFENFPHTGFSKTYCVDKQVADSACTSTAYLAGVKANYGTLGVTATVKRGNCSLGADPKNHVESILSWAQAAGKGTGLVTTAAITDASPSGGYSHVGDRDWQSDKDIKDTNNDPKICPDIAQQLIRTKPGSECKVVLGGGRKKFFPADVKDQSGILGERLDGANLVEEWLKEKKSKKAKATYIENKKGLLDSSTSTSDYILGLFQPDNMYYHLEKEADTQPTLEEMTKVAIERLQKEPNGYYLFVEGALIDKAHHKNWAQRALDETVEFSKAIETAIMMTKEEDTLIVVTADHAHAFSFGGYPERGNNILGTTVDRKRNITHAVLGYLNGPSAPKWNDTIRHDYTKDNMLDDAYQFPSLFELEDETHGGDDVAVYARGPWSHLFVGSYEQHTIPHMMAYAAKIGPANAATQISSSNMISPTPAFILISLSSIFIIFNKLL